jgi:twitching motility protein PilT
MQNPRLAELLEVLQRAGASTLHLLPDRVPALRLAGRMVPIEAAPWGADDLAELVRDLLFADHRQHLQSHGFVEVLYVAGDGRRFQATVAEHAGQPSLVMQALGSAPPRLGDLHLPSQVAALAQAGTGLVVVAGGFGSGCSETCQAIVDAWNQDAARHVATFETSIPCVHPPAGALLHQRQVGMHVGSVAEGVAQALTLGVDSVAVAAARDAADLDAVLTAAEAGCAVLLEVAAGSVNGALQQLLGLVPFEARARTRTRLARVLRGVVAQQLVAQREPAPRLVVAEVLMATNGVRAAIRAGNLHELPALMERGRGHGMQTREMALADLAK